MIQRVLADRAMRQRQRPLPPRSAPWGSCQPKWATPDFSRNPALPERSAAPISNPTSELFGRLLRDNGKILGLLAVPDFAKPLDREAALEQFPYCGRPARHPLRKPPRIDNPQFLRRQHDLEPLTSTEIAHLALPRNV